MLRQGRWDSGQIWSFWGVLEGISRGGQSGQFGVSLALGTGLDVIGLTTFGPLFGGVFRWSERVDMAIWYVPEGHFWVVLARWSNMAKMGYFHPFASGDKPCHFTAEKQPLLAY